MAKASPDETELRKFAIEQAVKVTPGTNGDVIVGLAGSIYTFLTGGAAPAAGSKPTPEKEPEPGNAAAGADAAGATDGNAAGSATSGSEGGAAGGVYDGDVAKLNAKCMALAQRDGAPALKAQFEAVGASKRSEVPDDKLATLYANLVAAGV